MPELATPYERILHSAAAAKPRLLAWHHGIAPAIGIDRLAKMREGLAVDDPSIIQGLVVQGYLTESTAFPFPCYIDRMPVFSACAIGWAAWRYDQLRAVGSVRMYVRAVLDAADHSLEQECVQAIVRGITSADWIDWYDTAPRADVLAELLAEVDLYLRTAGAK